MANKGWIKLHRAFMDNPYWKEKPFDKARACIDLMLLANHEEKVIMFNDNPMTIQRGQLLTSTYKLAERWGWTRHKVQRFLDGMNSDTNCGTTHDTNCGIKIDRVIYERGTLITIVNYGVFQGSRVGDRDAHDTISDTTHDTTFDTKVVHKQEEKKIRNFNNYYSAPKKSVYKDFMNRSYSIEDLEKEILSNG